MPTVDPLEAEYAQFRKSSSDSGDTAVATVDPLEAEYSQFRKPDSLSEAHVGTTADPIELEYDRFKKSDTPETDKVISEIPSIERMPPIEDLRSGIPKVIEGSGKPLVSSEVATAAFRAPLDLMGVTAIPLVADKVFPGNPITQAQEGAIQAAGDLTSSLSSPQNIALMAAGGGLGKLGTVLLSAGFEAQALRHFPDQYKEFKDAYEAGDYQKATRLGMNMAGGLGLPIAAVGAHVASSPESATLSRPTQENTLQEAYRPAEGTTGGEVNTERIRTDQEQVPVQGDVQETSSNQGSQNLEQQAQGQAVGGPGPVIREEVQPVLPEPIIGTEAAIAEIQRRNTPDDLFAEYREAPSGENPVSTEPIPPVETGGINARSFEKIYGEGEIPVGESITPEQIFNQGQVDLASGIDPYSFAARARTGNVTPRELGLLAAEHDRLVTEAAAREGTPEYEAAYQKSQDFAKNMLKPAGTRWHQIGIGLQVEAPINYSNLTGFRRAVNERLGREMTPEEAPAFKRISDDVSRVGQEATKTAVEGAERVNKRFSKVKDVPFEDAVKELQERITQAVKDCNL